MSWLDWAVFNLSNFCLSISLSTSLLFFSFEFGLYIMWANGFLIYLGGLGVAGAS